MTLPVDRYGTTLPNYRQLLESQNIRIVYVFGNPKSEATQICHLIGPGGVTGCSRCHGAPSRRWIPAFGDLCVTPPVGDSVAEMASISSGEPPNLDSRLRGNDGDEGSSPGSPVHWAGRRDGLLPVS